MPAGCECPWRSVDPGPGGGLVASTRGSGNFRHLVADSIGRPYVSWDEDVTLDQFRARLRDPDRAVRAYFLGKLMRQAKPDDVFTFVTLRELEEQLAAVEPKSGRAAQERLRSLHQFMLKHPGQEAIRFDLNCHRFRHRDLAMSGRGQETARYRLSNQALHLAGCESSHQPVARHRRMTREALYPGRPINLGRQARGDEALYIGWGSWSELEPATPP
jgi:hypothetical protein